MTIKERMEGLTEEQREKAKNCHSEKELLALFAEEGIELSDEDLDLVSGGTGGWGYEK